MRGAGLASVAGAVWWRNAHNFFTNPAFILPGVLFPLFFFTAFAGGLSRINAAPGFDYPPGYTAWTYGFVLLQASAFGGVFTGFSVARDFESGFARRIMLAAQRRGGIVLGYVLAALTRAGFTVTVITAVALITGLQLDGAGVDLVALYVLAMTVNVAATLFSMGVAMRLRTMQAGPAMQVPVFLLLFLAPVWVPLDLLTGAVKTVASLNPVTALLETSRGFIAGDPTKVGLTLALIALMIAGFGVWARGGLRSAERAA
jgi:ABC-2 type transport system permease protein